AVAATPASCRGRTCTWASEGPVLRMVRTCVSCWPVSKLALSELGDTATTGGGRVLVSTTFDRGEGLLNSSGALSAREEGVLKGSPETWNCSSVPEGLGRGTPSTRAALAKLAALIGNVAYLKSYCEQVPTVPSSPVAVQRSLMRVPFASITLRSEMDPGAM